MFSANRLQTPATTPLLELALCTLLQERCETALPFQDLGDCSRTSCQAGRLGHCPGAFCAISGTEGSRTAPIDHLGFFLPWLQQIKKGSSNLLVMCMLCQPRRSFLMLSTACQCCDHRSFAQEYSSMCKVSGVRSSAGVRVCFAAVYLRSKHYGRREWYTAMDNNISASTVWVGKRSNVCKILARSH